MRELFVYYRIRAEDAATAQPIVLAFQNRLGQRYPLMSCRLMRRADGAGSDQTWMEHYAVDARHHSNGISLEQQASIEAEAGELRAFIVGERHVEVFVDFGD